jgi:hypothetical protein
MMAKNTGEGSKKSAAAKKSVPKTSVAKKQAVGEAAAGSRKRSILSPVIEGSRTPEQFRAAVARAARRSAAKPLA